MYRERAVTLRCIGGGKTGKRRTQSCSLFVYFLYLFDDTYIHALF
jgi:hypothetical protein